MSAIPKMVATGQVQSSNLKSMVAVVFLFQSKSGRTSAPLAPHALQTNRASRSDSLASSGHRSPLIANEWLQR
jgi:hypothetical protein